MKRPAMVESVCGYGALALVGVGFGLCGSGIAAGALLVGIGGAASALWILAQEW